jgi:hypothetical protein
MELEMICVCGAEGVREVEARRLRIFRRMGLDDPGDLTTAIVLSLAFDFQAEAHIAADQWFGVSLTTPLVENGAYVECDWPYDGLAALWEKLAEAFPDRVTVKAGTSAPHVRVAERLSEAFLVQYEAAEAKYREHRAAAHRDDNDCPPCEDCSVYRALSIQAHRVLDDAWGSDVLDQATREAFE